LPCNKSCYVVFYGSDIYLHYPNFQDNAEAQTTLLYIPDWKKQ